MPSGFPTLKLPPKGSSAAPRLGDRLVDGSLELVAARLRPNSTLAVAYDLKVFFTVVGKDPAADTRADVVAFVLRPYSGKRPERHPHRGFLVDAVRQVELHRHRHTVVVEPHGERVFTELRARELTDLVYPP